MNLRQELEAREERILSPQAARSVRSRGRQRPEEECSLRPAFQHDRDRILYSKAFRRLKHKTQVFLSPTGDHYRTRLTHTLEVSQIARTMARALNLNEDLTEAIALGHDLGHTPFGHAGESVLNQLMLPGGFRHYEQSLRVVDKLEKGGRGLNLTFEVRMGILHHSKGRGDFLPDNCRQVSGSLEACLVRAADLMAYVAHDTDDAMRGGLLSPGDLPREVVQILGDSLSTQINTMVRDLISRTREAGAKRLCMSGEVEAAMSGLRDFLYLRVYENPVVHRDFEKASKVIGELFHALLDNDDFFAKNLGRPPEKEQRMTMTADFIAGMTDRYALKLYEEAFMPHSWSVL